MKTILVPLDGSKLAEQALPLATALATRTDGALVLTGAISPPDQWVDSETSLRWEEEERAAAEKYLAARAAEASAEGAAARTRVEIGQPHVVIAAAADEEAAELIVMTTHGRSGVSRWTLGSVSDKVLRTTSTPLLLVHPGAHQAPPATINRIVLALDGSSLAEAALPDAEQFARALGASLLLVRAVVPPELLLGAELVPGALPAIADLEAGAIGYLETVAGKVRSRGVDVAVHTGVGLPSEVILDAAADNGAGLIVLSTHGRSGIDRWFLGSVADAVVRHGDIPVLVVRTWVSLADGDREQAPVAGQTVVPPPVMSESPVETEPLSPAPALRPHRPERHGGDRQ